MVQRSFRIDLIGSSLHSERTLEIFRIVKKRSKFIRYAIMEYAKKEGFDKVEFDNCQPDFLDDCQWEIYKDRISPSERKYVDYSYYLAFHWLRYKFQLEHPITKAKIEIGIGQLLREIIENSNDLIPTFQSEL